MEIDISVRGLVEFVFRSGDIDSTYMSMKRALEGSNIHTKFQKIRKQQANSGNFIYRSEISLKQSFYYKDFRFNINGRADGLMIKEDDIYIEEIKSTYKDLELIEAQEGHPHLAQAKTYAFIYADLYELA
ncbi:MAG: ATP-dependent DNA helicase, partial [Clostridiales bacterium]|nr:ATP-dependent DNA helicase [Clostridiales bacterium]